MTPLENDMSEMRKIIGDIQEDLTDHQDDKISDFVFFKDHRPGRRSSDFSASDDKSFAGSTTTTQEEEGSSESFTEYQDELFSLGGSGHVRTPHTISIRSRRRWDLHEK